MRLDWLSARINRDLVYHHLQIIIKDCPLRTCMLLALVQQLLYAIKLQKIRVGDCIRLVLNAILLSCLVEKNLDMLYCSVRSETQQSEKRTAQIQL